MKPKFTYSNETDIPDNLKTLYVKQGDAWVIDLDGAPDPKKLAEFRDNNIKLQKELSDLKDKFKDLDPDEARRLMSDKAAIEAEKGKLKGDVEAAVKARLEPIQKDHEAKLAAAQKEATEAAAKLNAHLIRSAVSTAAVKEGARPAALDDLIARANGALVVENGELVVKDAKGGTRYNTTGSPMTVGEWMAEQAKTAEHLFEPNRGANSPGGNQQQGKGGPGGPNPWDPKTFNLTQQGILFKQNPAQARALAAQHGVRLPE